MVTVTRARPPLGLSVWLGASAALLVVFLTLGTLAAVFFRAEPGAGLGPADWAAVRFTLVQAILSATISVVLAIPVARALARRRFRGRTLLITLLGAPFILPVIVAIMGLVAIFGRSGLFNSVTGLVGLPPMSIYGLQGVLIAHVFFNLPLATRLLLQGWLAIPAERFRLAESLDARPRDIGRLLERPMLWAVIPGAWLTIFLLCLTSFAVALTLGGGPRATTVELAIYQAFRFDFDLGHAARLAAVQFALCLLAGVLTLRVALPEGFGAGLDRTVSRRDAAGPWHRLLDWVVLGLATAFLLAPLGAAVAAGLPQLTSLGPGIWWSALRSLLVALGSATLMVVLALPLTLAAQTLGRRGAVLEAVGMLTLAASPLVMGTGLFILIQPFARPGDLALGVTLLVNAAMSLPFALRAILPALRQAESEFGRLADSLDLTGAARLRLLLLPRLRRPLGFALGLTAALSMGDLGVIALFAQPGNDTLPLQIFRLMTAYRLDQAASASLLLLVLSLGLFWIFDRGGRGNARV